MKHVKFIIIAAIFTVIATACRTTRPAMMPEVVTIHERDTVTVETIIEKTLTPDTVFVEIPAQTAERTTADSLSFLENDFAMSSARINPDGTLFHTLMSKPGKLPVEVMTPTTNTTTNAERIREIEKPVPVCVPVEVERKMTWWERMFIKSAPWLFALLIAACVYIFRTPLTNFARRFIGSK